MARKIKKPIVYGGLWVKMQIAYIERRFGRKLKKEEVEALIEYFKNEKNKK